VLDGAENLEAVWLKAILDYLALFGGPDFLYPQITQIFTDCFVLNLWKSA